MSKVPEIALTSAAISGGRLFLEWVRDNLKKKVN